MSSGARQAGFRHEALLYAGAAQFVEAATSFVRAGLEAGGAVLVVVSDESGARLRESLGRDAGAVAFADMERAGRNPARLIPMWRRFVSENAAGARPIRGIGEPIWPGRSQAELVECQLHEALLNLAFADTADFSLLCPYDTNALEPAVIDEALHTHPHTTDGCSATASDRYRQQPWTAARFAEALPEPPPGHRVQRFETTNDLQALRQFVRREAEADGLDQARTDDLTLAVHEAAVNSLEHGGGHGALRMWSDEGSLFCEISDDGRFALADQPLVGRTAPEPDDERGRGVWVLNQLTDLTQIRSGQDGTSVRLRMCLS